MIYKQGKTGGLSFRLSKFDMEQPNLATAKARLLNKMLLGL